MGDKRPNGHLKDFNKTRMNRHIQKNLMTAWDAKHPAAAAAYKKREAHASEETEETEDSDGGVLTESPGDESFNVEIVSSLPVPAVHFEVYETNSTEESEEMLKSPTPFFQFEGYETMDDSDSTRPWTMTTRRALVRAQPPPTHR